MAVLRADDREALGAKSPVVLLSHSSLAEHLAKHPEIGLADYRKIQRLLDSDTSNVWRQGDDRFVYVTLDGVRYRAVLKRTETGRKNYFLSLFRDSNPNPPHGAVRVR